MAHALLLIMSIFLLTTGSFVNYQFKLLTFGKKIKVVMYHSISTNQYEDQITISKEKFIKQLEYYKKEGYNSINLSDVEKGKIPKKALMITFDDGFLDNYEEALPLLKEYDLKSVCFLVLGRIGKTMDWSGEYVVEGRQLMKVEQIRDSDPYIQFAYHTYKHDNYEYMALGEIKKDLELCKSVVKEHELDIFPALAYTYGGYYRKKGKKQNEFFSLLKEFGIKYAFRVGNRIAVFPLSNKMEITRIDIRGNESMEVFEKRIRWGRIKLM